MFYLLDEPTNNLDKVGISHLTNFLINYQKTCIVISHDSNFLNKFTDGVLNLDIHTHKIEQFVGNYFDVIEEIAAKLGKRSPAEFPTGKKALKIGLRKLINWEAKYCHGRLARRIRGDIEEDSEEMVEMRSGRQNYSLLLIFPCQEYVGDIIKINRPIVTELVKGSFWLLVKGPNGIGKSTLLKSIMQRDSAEINPKIRVGYYSQDFSELDFNQTAYSSRMKSP